MPSLAVVIVSYNVRELLRACLRATYASLALAPELTASIIVVDNASADGSAEMVGREFPQATLLARADNLGFAGGNNLALRSLGFADRVDPDPGAALADHAERASGSTSLATNSQPDHPERVSGSTSLPKNHQSKDAVPSAVTASAKPPPDLVLLLNPDAEPLADAIGQMAGFLLANPQAGGAGAQLQYPDGRFQHGAFRFPNLCQLWFDFFMPRPRRLLESRLNGRYAHRLYAAGRPFLIDFALGAALMVRREAIEAAGLLDEGYFMYAEEVDWCWRIQRAGWPFYGVPAARVIHHGGASTRQFRTGSFLNLWRSRRRLYRRFYSPLRQRIAGLIVRFGMRAEARRARAEAAQGHITADELAERQDAIHRVTQLFSGGS